MKLTVSARLPSLDFRLLWTGTKGEPRLPTHERFSCSTLVPAVKKACLYEMAKLSEPPQIPQIRYSPPETISLPCEAFSVDVYRLPASTGVMKPPDVEKLIAKMDPAVSKIYYDAKHVLETVEDSESEEFLAAARIVKMFWNTVMRQINKPGSDS